MQVSEKMDNMPLRDVVTYEYDDMLAYVSITAFVAMTTVLFLILSL